MADEPSKSSESSSQDAVEQAADLQDDSVSDVFVKSWSWDDKDEVLVESDGAWYLALSAKDAKSVDEDEVKALLPKKVKATLSNGEKATVSVSWGGGIR